MYGMNYNIATGKVFGHDSVFHGKKSCSVTNSANDNDHNFGFANCRNTDKATNGRVVNKQEALNKSAHCDATNCAHEDVSAAKKLRQYDDDSSEACCSDGCCIW